MQKVVIVGGRDAAGVLIGSSNCDQAAVDTRSPDATVCFVRSIRQGVISILPLQVAPGLHAIV